MCAVRVKGCDAEQTERAKRKRQPEIACAFSLPLGGFGAREFGCRGRKSQSVPALAAIFLIECNFRAAGFTRQRLERLRHIAFALRDAALSRSESDEGFIKIERADLVSSSRRGFLGDS